MLAFTVAATLSLWAQATDPPPLPDPVPAAPPADTIEAAAAGDPTIDKYQHCFQKMIDQRIDGGAADNVFMRQCLGLPPKGSKRPPPAPGRAPTPGQVFDVASQSLPTLQACYQGQLDKLKALGVKTLPRGAIELTWTITAAGAVEEVAFAATSITDADLLSCLRKRVAEWRISRGAGGDKLAADLTLFLSIGRGAKAQVAIDRSSIKLSGPDLRYGADELLATFQRHAGSVRRCYDTLLKREPAAQGAVAVDVTVNARGRVTGVSFRQATLDDKGFQSCLVATIRSWRFPPPRARATTVARYPQWSFKPAATP